MVLKKMSDLENRKCEIYNTASNELDMLTGNINRMFVCDDIEELDKHLSVAKNRIDEIYKLNNERLKINSEMKKYKIK